MQELKPHGTFVRGEVAELSPTAAVLSDGSKIEFDYCAIATGSSQTWGKGEAITAEQRRAEIRSEHAALLAAPAVVVVGGGSLGVEIAGEVLTDYPGKPIYLVHRGRALMQSIPGRASRLALNWLRAHGCKVLLGQRLVEPPAPSVGGGPGQGQLVTSGGEVLPEGSKVLWATGTRPNTRFMGCALAGALDSRGLIKVCAGSNGAGVGG